MNFPKLYIGTVSKNVIIAATNVSDKYSIPLGLIPSRRQIDYNEGYIGITTPELSRMTNNKLILERDHGGPAQGSVTDNGIASLIEDSKYFDIIHLDPFKVTKDLDYAAELTIMHLEYLNSLNNKLYFEIGTEEGIRKYSYKEFEYFLSKVCGGLRQQTFKQILYVVVQGGTLVKAGGNIGSSDSLSEYINVCKSFDKMSKEHNGDYISLDAIKNKFTLGLSALNIAPEFGTIESELYLNHFSEQDKELFFSLVLNSNRWQKWFSPSFKPEDNKEQLIKMCGHYMFNDLSFIEIQKKYNLNDLILDTLEQKILSIAQQTF